jgi:sn-glycerol 3-phosphate transport system permease protein
MNDMALKQSTGTRKNWRKLIIHLLLIISVCLIGFPLYYGFVISTQSMEESIQKPQRLLPSIYFLENYIKVWNRIHMGQLLINSGIVAFTVSLGKILISILSAFAIVYFNFRGKQIAFWLIFITLMLPVPVRIISTYQVVASMGWVDTYAGLTIPLIASATALFVVMFIYGWNQYLWPLMVTSSEKMKVVVVGIASTVPTGTQPPEWNLVMAAAMMALLPPVLVVILMQRWFVHGLIESEK